MTYSRYLARFSNRLDGMQVEFLSRPGFPAWQELFPSAHLLAEYFEPGNVSRLLWMGCGHGAAVVVVLKSAPTLHAWLMDPNVLALESAAATLANNGISNATLHPSQSYLLDHGYVLSSIEPPGDVQFDAVVIDLPKGRTVVRNWLALASHSLRPGGSLWLAGAKNLGIEPALKDATTLFGPGSLMGYKKGNRVARFIYPGTIPVHGWWTDPGFAPASWQEIQVDTPGDTFPLVTLPGVFASGHIDEGTRLLLETITNFDGHNLLDLGCGVGVIGIHALRSGALHADLVDTSLPAAVSAAENLRRLRLADRGQVFAGDGLEAVSGRRYSLILSNPPFHTGKGIDYAMTEKFIKQSRQALEPGGRLVLVSNRFIRYDRHMKGLFQRVSVIAENPSFHVFSGEI